MAVGYRSIFSLRDGQDALQLTAEQFRSWLALKGYGVVALAPGVHELAEHAHLVVTELHPGDASRSLRYRLTESSSAGDWVTTVTVHRDGKQDGDWIWVDVNAPPSTLGPAAPFERLAKDVDAADAWWTGVPHMVQVILAGADVRDGEMILSAQPTVVTVADVDNLISAICDPGRRGNALVAAPVPDVPIAETIGYVARLTRECVGLAGIYVLDSGAAAQLEESFAPSHSVPPGAVRTFMPEADPASTVDARRHRVLLARTIAEQAPGRLAHILGRASRRRALNLPLPSHVAGVDRLLSREEPAAVLRAIQETPPGPGAVDGAAGLAPGGQATTSAVREVIIAGELLTSLVSEFQSGTAGAGGPDDMTARFRELLAEGRGVLRGQREISRRLAALQDLLDDAEDDRDLLRARLEDEQLDHAETQAELLAAKLELDRLRAVISRAGRIDHTRAAAAAAQSPGSFAELLERLDRHVLSCVIFTGDPKNALELDDFDPLGTWAAKSWDVLRVLDGYAAARRGGDFSKGVHAYLGHTPAGRPGYSPGAHSTQESEPVDRSPRLRKLRVFPVPRNVHPDGAIFMDAHFKIARRGLVSPRIYYHDDASRTGKIYVGYIGKHLPNAGTN